MSGDCAGRPLGGIELAFLARPWSSASSSSRMFSSLDLTVWPAVLVILAASTLPSEGVSGGGNGPVGLVSLNGLVLLLCWPADWW